jgi:hypothetical protein
MLERQKEGIANAKTLVRCNGRKPLARHLETVAKDLARDGLGKADIVKRIGLSERSAYRLIR